MENIIVALLILNVVFAIVTIVAVFLKNEKPIDTSFVGKIMGDEFSRSRGESLANSKSLREELNLSIKNFGDDLRIKFNDFGVRQDSLKTETEAKLEKIRETVELKIKGLQDENSKKLDEMRNTVDEKLQSTLEKRFNDSFKMISERLEQVHKGLGEMQTLASGVGDLKKVLTNVKTRGNLGEIQLGAILEQFLSPDQYCKNAQVKHGSAERVEYAVNLPGKNIEAPLLLSIDSKFPVEDYQRLLEAYEFPEGRALDVIIKQFENSVKKNAKDIRDKYINPPLTTDFAIMFVPTEGLYAEILRCNGLFEMLQRDYKVVVIGPTNLVAFLSSLQMGFRTLAVEKRSSEVWEILGAVKNEFGKFGDILEKTKKKLQEASNTIDDAGVRARQITKQLKHVQELPSGEAKILIEEALEEEILQDEVA